jgi:hypothetical protein
LPENGIKKGPTEDIQCWTLNEKILIFLDFLKWTLIIVNKPAPNADQLAYL